ncbi:methylmalonyl Co-A mutase-associated GTPase MeaB [Acidobacteriia bacterium AH_259_A11_L15]|nr:methylmalonyl Co-A mutase-associated GTPase MeaB [Acidobacteriia bacterium AH_259_A11_L15]
MRKSAGVQSASVVEGVRGGDPRAIARAISALENREPGADRIVQELFPYTGKAVLIGLTGAPGTGKSSLANCLARHYREQGKRVGVLAVDPTSPFTGGALLGDRIRMQQHATDQGIYIRSMATRGMLGGLARATADAALVLDAAGKDLIFVETVGVGQDEVEIMRLADVTVLLLVAGYGDDVQNFKAGVMEIADIFVLNKADRGDTDRLENELKVVLGLGQRPDHWHPPIVKTVATDGAGVPELAAALEDYRAHLERVGLREEKSTQRWQERLVDLIRERAVERVVKAGLGKEQLADYARQVARRERDPYTVVEELLRTAGIAE